jgi:3D (Asp-Asp-Asp) domain-containing protein
MIRILYCFCFLVCATALPLLAENISVDDLIPSSTSKGTKCVPPPSSDQAVTRQKTAPVKKLEIAVTSDATRATRSASALASVPAQSAQIHHADKKAAESASKVASTTTAPSKISSERSESVSEEPSSCETRLARVTAYWASEGDYYTGRGLSATGVRLHEGHCAVDPNIIPYGSVVEIAGVGKFLAVDTGSAVISRTAAREGGRTYEERHAIVVDVFFEDASEGERFAARAAKFVAINWWTPHSTASQSRAAGGLFAEEDWTKIQSKQL